MESIHFEILHIVLGVIETISESSDDSLFLDKLTKFSHGSDKYI